MTTADPLRWWEWANTNVLKHPAFLLVLGALIGAVLAYVFTERWQRARQRREFQFRTMSRFSEVTAELLTRIQERYGLRRTEQGGTELVKKFLEFSARRSVLFALEPELVASFGSGIIHNEYTQLLTATRLFVRAGMTTETTEDTFKVLEERCLDSRTLILTRMIAAMSFLAPKEYREAIAHLKPRTASPDDSTLQ